MGLGKARVLTDERAEDVGRSRRIVFLAQHQSQLYACASMVWVNRDRLVQFSRALIKPACLCQRQSEVVMRFGEVRVAHHRLPEFLQSFCGLILAPVNQPQT